MKKGLKLILTLVIGFGLGLWFNEMNRFAEGVATDTKVPDLYPNDSVFILENTEIGKEDFDEFFYKFIIEPDFQLSRIKFPLEFVGFKDGYPGKKTDTIYLKKDQWKHNHYYLNESSIPVIYDNYEMKLKDTDERIFVWSGVENGIYMTLYFRRIEGKWFLKREEDFST